MSSVRLLPIVIMAAAALLLFKGVGLLTTGGYMFTGTETAMAAGDGGHGAPDRPAGEAGDGAYSLAPDPVMTDTSPTLEDRSLVLGGKDESGHGAPTTHGDAHAAADTDDTRGAPAPDDAHGAPATEAVAAAAEPRTEGVPQVERGGQLEPLLAVDSSEGTILERLQSRRLELDEREAELEMRTALVEAAERRMSERAAELNATEQRINALVADKQAAEDEAFQSLVGMYETMKPKEAAAIFDALDPVVLTRVARAMSPRKMAPIMARMTPGKAQQLTQTLAMGPTPVAASAETAGLDSLPQIIGR